MERNASIKVVFGVLKLGWTRSFSSTRVMGPRLALLFAAIVVMVNAVRIQSLERNLDLMRMMGSSRRPEYVFLQTSFQVSE
jgi:hypothetical protein